MPHVLPDHFEIKRPERPDRIPRHAAIVRHNSHNTILDHEPGQSGQFARELLILVARLEGRMEPPVAVLAAEGMELIGQATDDAFDALLAFGRGDGDDGDEVFALRVGVGDGPLVVLFHGVQEGFLGAGVGEDLVADAGAGHDEVGEGTAGAAGRGVVVVDVDLVLVVGEELVGKGGVVHDPGAVEQGLVAAECEFGKEPSFFLGPLLDARIVVVEVDVVVTLDDLRRRVVLDCFVVFVHDQREIVVVFGSNSGPSGSSVVNHGVAFEILPMIIGLALTGTTTEPRCQVPKACPLLALIRAVFFDNLALFHFA